MVSAHWYINATAVTAMRRPRTIHDFFGFPQRLFDIEYPAPGLPELVQEVSDAVQPTWVGADVDSWGIDHGTWSVLVHAFPEADIPVVQLSINAEKPLDYHLGLGAQAGPAARQRRPRRRAAATSCTTSAGSTAGSPDEGFDWAHRFDDDARERMLDDPAAVAGARRAPRLRHAPSRPPTTSCRCSTSPGWPTRAGERSTDVLVDGYAYGSLSMTAYTLDLPCHVDGDGPDAAAELPADVPPDHSNI